MAYRVNGECVATYKWSTMGGGLQDRCAELYQMKGSVKIVVWNCRRPGWKGEGKTPCDVFEKPNMGEAVSVVEKMMADPCAVCALRAASVQ